MMYDTSIAMTVPFPFCGKQKHLRKSHPRKLTANSVNSLLYHHFFRSANQKSRFPAKKFGPDNQILIFIKFLKYLFHPSSFLPESLKRVTLRKKSSLSTVPSRGSAVCPPAVAAGLRSFRAEQLQERAIRPRSIPSARRRAPKHGPAAVSPDSHTEIEWWSAAGRHNGRTQNY